MSDRLCQRITPDVKLRQNVQICDFVNLYGCEIGDDTKIGTFVEIQKGARIGRNCKSVSKKCLIPRMEAICSRLFVEENQ
jgi:UDP-2-acetamido-3-amino-2,3-dideoxy-glucuronate N-acetyltransferase